MCLCDLIKNKYLLIFDLVFLIAIIIMHFVFYFNIKQTNLEYIFQAFDSSPLFDSRVSTNCDTYSHIIFHVWEGIDDQSKTNIEKINGNFFCYKKILYKDLLYNDQIIKKGENCPQKYNKNCGVIDTLQQQLCIKNEENCPLYDIGIGIPPNNENYETQGNIYYNKNTYLDPNKKIIGKLILNDGQPCYRLNEKLWRKIIFSEVGEEHLECELEIFDKLKDDRYERKGDITYDQLYKDNLGNNYNLFIEKEELKNQKVSLYTREFLGIDKSCDEKKEISKENYNKLRKNQKMVKICLLVEAIIIFSVFFLMSCFFCLIISALRHGGVSSALYELFLIFLIIILSLNLVCIICQSIFLGRIIKYDLDYDCSDDITNEVLRQENINTKKSIKYTAINLGADIFYILFNVFFVFIIYIKKNYNCDCDWKLKKEKKDKYKDNNNINKKISSNDSNKKPIDGVIAVNRASDLNEKKIDSMNKNMILD